MKRKTYTKRRARAPKVTPAIKKYVSKKLDQRIEDKYQELYASGGQDINGSLQDLTSGITVGTGDTGNRIGDSIRYKYLLVDYAFELADTFNLCRVIIFQWLSSSSAGVSSVLSQTGTTYAPQGYYQHDNMNAGMFKIMYDDKINLNAGYPVHRRTLTLRNFKLKKVQFSAGGSTLIKGGLYALFVSDSGAVSHPVATITSRIVYEDG